MAYFPNGTAGMMFQEDYCLRCVNYRDKNDGRGHGCALFDAHMFFPSHITPKGGTPERSKQQEVLDFLIPDDDDCTMFVDDGKDHMTLPLFKEA